MIDTPAPALRPLDFQPITHQGQQMWLLRDPLQLSTYQLIFPPALAQMLIYLDGRHTLQEIHHILNDQLGLPIDAATLEDALYQLDKALLLDNNHAQQAKAELLAQYRAQPYRPPALADLSYPADPDALTALFDSYGADDDLSDWLPWHGRALVSPHIDYQRGGPVYAKVWRRAETAVLDADLIIILGTDHNGGFGTFTPTTKPYATPYGLLPTDETLINQLAAALGPEAAFAEELHHRQEHSVELSAVWLHYIYHKAGVSPKPMIPILVGSFHHFVANGGHPAKDPFLVTAVNTLQQLTAGKKTLIVASVDLAHVGPNFGDSYIMDDVRRQQLQISDQALIQSVLQGSANGFYNQIAQVSDKNRICGFSPIFLMLQYLNQQASGIQVAYDHCPADDKNHSLVSICGLLLN